ncbi:MAG: hypothetical protein ACD_44C00387G0005 [uncultured bacterium]|nr:MAG: hypothetical protein ACD_44C00387G0005 [uncultured bacterium]OGT23206.1 MAG: hypothetical protein A2W47_00575 [Gammaproteobacteria bacterium RIFCSPHIGHO2_12_38_15]OGT68237.1 MAG: hypothetical protein A3I12_05295 [Gammaproteobacteria bacterium RIFCSPLOWO2_02_FULL_38_11]OGT76195.1 MAG: hypothetical protein A3G71_05945 [Gammaproteobacteria bacterium RIFCSPLOWO2_12_FULL_38_14]
MLKTKSFTTAIVVIAVLMAISATFMPPEKVGTFLLPVARFFEVMIPILGVGALLKYLCCCHHSHCDDHHGRK